MGSHVLKHGAKFDSITSAMMTYWRAAEVEARVASALRSSKECEQVCEFESVCVRASKHISV